MAGSCFMTTCHLALIGVGRRRYTYERNTEMIKAVIFDIGGVLAHDVWEHLLMDNKQGVLSICNLDETEVKKAGSELWEEFAYQNVKDQKDEWKKLEEEYWDRFKKRFRIEEPIDRFIEMTKNFIRPVEGMVALVETLNQKGIDLAICSNNNEFWFKRQMDELQLHRFFDPDKIILSCRVGVSKSSPNFEMFNAASDALGGDRASYAFVDDRAGNVERALQCDMVGILFPPHSKYGSKFLEVLLKNMAVL